MSQLVATYLLVKHALYKTGQKRRTDGTDSAFCPRHWPIVTKTTITDTQHPERIDTAVDLT